MRLTNPWWTLVLASAVTAPTFAGDLDVSPFVEYSVDYDNNLFSEARANERADTVRHATLGVLADWPISRQQFAFSAQTGRFSYDRFQRLNHSEYKGRAAWQYQLGSIVHGTASYQQERYLGNFTNRSTRQADFIRQSSPQLAGYLELTPDWQVHARGGYLQLDHSLNSEQRFDRRQTESFLALQYTGISESVFAAGAEVTDGKFPQRGAGDPLSRTFVQYTPFINADWKYSGVSRFQAQLGYTRRNNDGGQQRDFSGITGRLGYVRTISAKTRLTLEVSRQIYSVDDVNADYERDTGGKINLVWRYSPKLGVSAYIARRREDYQAMVGTQVRHDTVNDFASELTLKPYRRVELVSNVRYRQRDSNFAGETYDDLVVGVALRVTLNPPLTTR